MNQPSVTLLSTKKLQQAVKQQLQQQGIEVIDYSFIEKQTGDYQLVAAAIKNKPGHYVFTSKTAVEIVKQTIRYYKLKIPEDAVVYCLEGNTQKTILSLRLKPLLTATSARQLAQMVIKKGRSKSVVFFCSDKRRNDLPDLLNGAGICVKEVEVYKTKMTPYTVTGKYNGVLFFSPSGVQSFFQSNAAAGNIPCICIGNTTANEVKKIYPQALVVVASRPSLQNMLQAAAPFLNSNETWKPINMKLCEIPQLLSKQPPAQL